MRIDCYLSEHCGSYHRLKENIEQALRELSREADVLFHTVYYDDAVALGIPGSPTVRVNGRDLLEIEVGPGIT